MAAYQSLEIAQRFPVSGPGMGGRKSEHPRAEFTTTAALAAGDTIDLFYLPPGARVVSGFIKGGNADSGAGLTLNVGLPQQGSIAAQPALFFSASTAGQNGAPVDRNMLPAGVDYYTNRQRTLVQAQVAAAPATGVVGATIVVVFTYTVEEPR